MKDKGKQIERQAEDAIRFCLKDVPFCRVEFRDNPRGVADNGIDLIGSLITNAGKRPLVVEVKPNGQPRWARNAANALALYRTKNPSAYGILVAPYITEEAGRIAAENGIGYVDLAGNCRIAFDQVYIRREGRENKFTRKRDLRSLFSPKAERVLRMLLLEPKRGWKVEELAKVADVSLGQASNVKKLLDDREWLRRGERGLELIDPKKLLTEWSQNFDPSRSRSSDLFSLDPIGKIESKIADACKRLGVRYALTGFSGAARLAPAVRYQRASVYIAEKLDEVATAVGLRPVTSGANVSVIEPYDDGVFAGTRKIGGADVASPVQVFLDLSAIPGRGEEAADALLREVIEPSW